MEIQPTSPTSAIKRTLAGIFRTDLKFDWKIVTITVVSTLLIMVDQYHQIATPEVLDRTILYLLIPLAIIILIFRERPSAYGFRIGNWREGIFLTLAAIFLMTPVLWVLNSPGSSMQKYYAPLGGGLPIPAYAFLELFGWEFLFRGWILFGYQRKFGAEALWLQAVPFALAHLGKPEIETLSTVFGGFAFGWIAWRTRSFLYPFLIHWYILTLTLYLAMRSHG